jgi:hypothetical protein
MLLHCKYKADFLFRKIFSIKVVIFSTNDSVGLLLPQKPCLLTPTPTFSAKNVGAAVTAGGGTDKKRPKRRRGGYGKR